MMWTGEMESMAAGVFVEADLHSVNHLTGDHQRIHGFSTSRQSPATLCYRCTRTTSNTLGNLPAPSQQAPQTPPE